jgi:hypothetical protein
MKYGLYVHRGEGYCQYFLEEQNGWSCIRKEEIKRMFIAGQTNHNAKNTS